VKRDYLAVNDLIMAKEKISHSQWQIKSIILKIFLPPVGGDSITVKVMEVFKYKPFKPELTCVANISELPGSKLVFCLP
jgi:hypothetical protein